MGRDPLAPVWCWWPTAAGRACPMPAGDGTDHPGYGPCTTHEPAAMRRAWRTAMAMAKELDVSPWEALSKAVRIAAARVEWVDGELRTLAAANDGGEPTPAVLELLKQSRNERRLLAQTSKAAIDAGLAERVVRQVELEGKVLADALDAALTAVGATADQRIVGLEAAHRALVATVDPATGVWGVSPAGSGPPADGPAEPYPDVAPPREAGAGGLADGGATGGTGVDSDDSDDSGPSDDTGA